MTKFFFFGCWNRDICDGQTIHYRNMVLEHLELAQEYKQFDFGVVAGDNIYPLKSDNKSKSYYGETIVNGFQKLQKSMKDKETHIILGNHNAQTNVLNKERELTRDNKLFALYEDIATVTSWSDDDNNVICNFIFLNTNTFIPDNMTSVVDELQNALNSCTAKTIYLVGHDPLVASKIKNGRLFTHIHGIKMILDVLFNYMQKTSKNITYLCADVHNFQALTITRVIDDIKYTLPIIVAGTGGADPDLDIFDPNIKQQNFKEDIDDYKVQVHMKDKPYGYCIIDILKRKIRYYKVIIFMDLLLCEYLK